MRNKQKTLHKMKPGDKVEWMTCDNEKFMVVNDEKVIRVSDGKSWKYYEFIYEYSGCTFND